jgi:hypothetical protein
MKLLVLGLLVSSFSFAGKTVYLECGTATPCKFYGKGMKYCISKIVVAGPANGYGSETISYRTAQIGRDLLIKPTQTTVAIKAGVNKISFQSADGDQWGDLQSVLGGRYAGVITVDQDFEFSVSCADKTIGYEKSR